VIPEPQRTFVLELFKALGQATDNFVLAGAQAMKFTLAEARATKDLDFILHVIRLRAENLQLGEILERLGYTAVEGARNFQFEKPIPGSQQKMRIEFMAPEEFKRRADFRVDIQEGVHARACIGGSIALAESDLHALEGRLPNGEQFATRLRVTRPHALVMLKLLALKDRYNNLRGPREARHDREEAQTHAADILAIVTSLADPADFKRQFERQFQSDPVMGIDVLRTLGDLFRETTSPGLLVYAEYLAANLPEGHNSQNKIRQETERGQRVMSQVLPVSEFYALAVAVDRCTDWQRHPAAVAEYLSELETSRTAIHQDSASGLLPSTALSGPFRPGHRVGTTAPAAMQKVTVTEADLLKAYLQVTANDLAANEELRQRFPHALSR
jgi:hypothetical protein